MAIFNTASALSSEEKKLIDAFTKLLEGLVKLVAAAAKKEEGR